ncbi:multiple epidermal growth factor-like domains protein 10 [Antedon mediterranea]|uniref:multiple epidermal growth factor-like domains protein 10 n=1 Tax=Antedon mediterranea TaxID=105859 RepID=UPI003AF428AE
MELHNLVCVVIFNVLLWKYAHTLDPNGENVCLTQVSIVVSYCGSQSYCQPYPICSSGPHPFLGRRCTRYITRCRIAYRWATMYKQAWKTEYKCCDGYRSLPGSNECTVPTCNPRCIHGYCANTNICECDPGYFGDFCENMDGDLIPK